MKDKNVIVGLFIIGMLAILILAMFSFPSHSTSKKPIFTIRFDEAKKLQPGDTMYLKGVKIGEVKSVKLDDSQRFILVQARLTSSVRLSDDSFFFIWPDKFVTGKKCIQVKPGSSSVLIQKGSLIEGESSYPKTVLKLGKRGLEELGAWWEGIEPILREELEDFFQTE